MYFFRKLFGLFFVGLLIFGLFGFFGRMGYGRYQTGYQQGFIAGQQAAAVGGTSAQTGAAPTTAVPAPYPGASLYFRGHGFFFPGFGLFLCLIPLFFIGLLSMAFGGRRRYGRRHHWRGGPCGPGPRHHHHRWPGEDPREKSPDDIDDGRDGGADGPVMYA